MNNKLHMMAIFNQTSYLFISFLGVLVVTIFQIKELHCAILNDRSFKIRINRTDNYTYDDSKNEQKLVDLLFHNYSSNIIPRRKTPLKLYMGMSMAQLINIVI